MANMNFGVNILPKANNTYTLGNSDYKWNIFANALNGVFLTNIITDIQINSTSILSNNIANIPLASYDDFGVLKLGNGLAFDTKTDRVVISAAGSTKIKAGADFNYPIVPVRQHEAVFYGLAKAAGDSTQAASSNAVGTYTADAKSAIQSMLGITSMTGATSLTAGTSGLVPAPATTDVDKFLAGNGTYKSGGLPMVILSYGNSTWQDFINAYNNNVIVYCRASSNSNPSTGSQTRMAFMAYVSDASNPTNVEFQYYRSMSSHSATAMGDEVYVYKLTNANGGTWSVTTRKASIKEIAVASGSKLGVSWSSDKVTLSNTMTADDMPMSSSDATTAKSAIDTINTKLGSTTMGTTATTVTGAIAEHESDISTLNSNMQWKELGVKTGTEKFSYPPSGWSEVFIQVANSIGYRVNVPINILNASINRNSDAYFRAGNYASASINSSLIIHTDSTGINLYSFYLDGNDLTSTATVRIFYR